MTICYFLTASQKSRQFGSGPDAAELAALERFLLATPALAELRLHTPSVALDPMLDDGAPPALALQLMFGDMADLEQAMSPGGYLQELPVQAAIKALGDAGFEQQAMLVRPYPVATPKPSSAFNHKHCTYLVAYEGPADDTSAWLWNYLESHPALMGQLPGVRLVEIYSRLDWCGFLPWPKSTWLQRNQVVFDSSEALSAALQSDLRVQMREQFRQMPAFSGKVTHFPMTTVTARPGTVSF